MDILRELSDKESVIGASALYVYESQAPLLSIAMPEALATHYGIDEDAGSFFKVHRPLDGEHAAVVRELVTAQSGGETDDPTTRPWRQPIAPPGRCGAFSTTWCRP